MKLDKLKQKMSETNKSILGLSKESGVPYATVYDILNNKAKNPRINTVEKIAGALGIGLDDICTRGIVNEENYFENKKASTK